MPVEINLEGKVAVVTGASRGIGRETALTLARAGATLVVTATENSRDRLESLVGEMSQDKSFEEGKGPFFVCGDISDEGFATSLIDQTVERLGRLDTLVNNAGIVRDRLTMRMTLEDWRDVMRVNLDPAFILTKAAMRPMIRQRSGSLIYVSSVVAHGNAGQANYAASKAGQEGFMRCIAMEVGSREIRANALEVGPVGDTGMIDGLSDELRERYQKEVPLQRFITKQEVANTVLFLASDLSTGITGSVINVDGGMRRQ